MTSKEVNAVQAVPLRIVIQEVYHSAQRYETVGDYFEEDSDAHDTGYGDKQLTINVSPLSKNEMLLIAIHELIEWTLCQAAGISNEEIDKFDLGYAESARRPDPDEPGDCSRAPYYRQHQIASGIERLLAAELGVDWLTYERHTEELSK